MQSFVFFNFNEFIYMFFFLVRHDFRHFPLRHPPYFYGGFFTFRHEPPSAINHIGSMIIPTAMKQIQKLPIVVSTFWK